MPSKQTRKPTRSSAVKRPGPANPATPTAISPVWERRLKELQAFKKKHGHCEVPHGYSPNPPLANWVARVRRLKQTGKIAPELARRLDELGFTWMLRRRAVFRHDWDAMVAALTAFKNQHGHCHVPWKPAKYRGLNSVAHRCSTQEEERAFGSRTNPAIGEAGRRVGTDAAAMGEDGRRACGVPDRARRLQCARLLAGESTAGNVGGTATALPKAERPAARPP